MGQPHNAAGFPSYSSLVAIRQPQVPIELPCLLWHRGYDWQLNNSGNRDVADEHEPSNTDWLTPLRESLKRAPRDYAKAHADMVAMRHTFLQEIAAALEPRLNEHLQAQNMPTFTEKSEACKTVNRDLRALNLCVRCPSTQGPSMLSADYSYDGNKNSRFRFQLLGSGRGNVRKDSSTTTPVLSLMEAPAREENLSMSFLRKRAGKSPER